MTHAEAVLLVERHGLEALEIFKNFGPDGYWVLEARHAIVNTMCLHLVDFYARRVPLILSEQDHGLSLLLEISEIFTKTLGWNAQEKALEESLLHKHLAHELAWRHKNV